MPSAPTKIVKILHLTSTHSIAGALPTHPLPGTDIHSIAGALPTHSLPGTGTPGTGAHSIAGALPTHSLSGTSTHFTPGALPTHSLPGTGAHFTAGGFPTHLLPGTGAYSTASDLNIHTLPGHGVATHSIIGAPATHPQSDTINPVTANGFQGSAPLRVVDFRPSVNPSTITTTQTQVKLPKISMKRLNGDLTK